MDLSGCPGSSHQEEKVEEDEEVLEHLATLSDDDATKLCEGNLIVDVCNPVISLRVFQEVLKMAEKHASNRNISVSNILCCLNPSLKDRGLVVSNLVRKFQRLVAKADKANTLDARNHLMKEVLVSCPITWPTLRRIFDIDLLTEGNIVPITDEELNMTKDEFIRLGEFIKRNKGLTWKKLAEWAGKQFGIQAPSESSLFKDFQKLKALKDKLRRNRMERESFLEEKYIFEPVCKDLPQVDHLPAADFNEGSPADAEDDEQLIGEMISCYETISVMSTSLAYLQASLWIWSHQQQG